MVCVVARKLASAGYRVNADVFIVAVDGNEGVDRLQISFLLEGGDNLTLAENAVSITTFEQEDIIDAVLEYVYAETAAGRPIEYQTDGRVVIKD